MSKNYADGATVLQNITLSVKPGEVVAIVGRSGVGKSTLLRVVAGLEAPTAGSISVDGLPVTKPYAGLGYLVQDYSHSLFPWLRVAGNLRLALRSSATPRAQWKAEISNALTQVGLEGIEHKFPWELSGGMQQRVALARSLLRRPRVLLLDEPFASVDALVRWDLEDLTRAIIQRHGITTLLVTHDVEEAIYMSDRIITLAGAPTGISSVIEVPLSPNRNQAHTRAEPEFGALRKRVLDALA